MNEQWLLLSVEYDEGVLGLLSWRVLAVYPIDKVSQFDKCSFKAAVVVICKVICWHGYGGCGCDQINDSKLRGMIV